MRVLIVRLSSMGDMVQTLPAITDASRAIPDLQVHWVVDRAFAEIPAWHRSVHKVIAAPPRRLSNLTKPEFKEFLRALREERYDFVVDLQGQWKSAFSASFAKGILCGYDRKSVNEWGSHLFYKRKFFVAKAQHSIQRMRNLLSRSLNYSIDSAPVDYGINRFGLPENRLRPVGPYLVFIHSTSWESKCWPENHWRELTGRAIESGFHIVLPWGNEAERARSNRIAASYAKAIVLPDLSISEKASVISSASGTVGLDTGLSHIAAALDVPSLTLYGATDPFFSGTVGKNQIHFASEFECVKCHRSSCDYTRPTAVAPACFDGMTPDVVWTSLRQLLLTAQS